MVDQTIESPQPNGLPSSLPSPADASSGDGRMHILAWIFCVFVVGAGVFFRVDNLRSLPVWHDEALQLMHSGGTTLGAEQAALQNHVVTFRDVARESMENGSHRKIGEIFPALYYDQPEHAPLSFLTMHLWGEKSGWSIGSMRTLAVAFGLLQLPLAFMLCWELSGSALGGVIAAALFACSPLLVHYSQELRDYSFTTFFTMATNVVFLRAYRKKLTVEWLLYPIVASLAIYSSILAFFTIGAHAVYVFWSDRIRVQDEGLALSVSATCFLVSTIAIGALTSPLSGMVITNLDRIAALTSWVGVPLPPGELINAIMFNPSQAFLWLQSVKPEVQNSLLAFLFLIEAFSVFVVWNRKSKLSFKFLVCLLLPVAVTVWLPDLIVGGQRSLYSKYFIAAPTSLLFASAIALQIAISSRAPGVRLLGGVCIFLVTACQLWSDFDLFHMTERGLIGHQKLAPVRQVLNENPGCLVVSTNTSENTNLMQMCALTQATPATTKLLWLSGDELTSLPTGTEQFFLFNPTPGLVQVIRKSGYSVSQVGKMDYFLKAMKSRVPRVVSPPSVVRIDNSLHSNKPAF